MKHRIAAKAFCFSAGLFGSLPLAHAALITQTNVNPNTSTFWNNAAIWGGNAVTEGNDYSTATGEALLGTSFIMNGKTWAFNGQIRDAGTGGGSTTFAGDRLILNDGVRLILKSKGNNTSTANIVMNDGGHIFLAADSGGTRTGNLAGSIEVAAGSLTAIGVRANDAVQTDTFNITSTISGGVGSTVQLALVGGPESGGQPGGGAARIHINGDYSNFAGTFYLGTPSAAVPSGNGAGNGTIATGSSFSFADGIALLATLHIAVHENVQFDLNSDIAFGSIILGDDTVLAPGTYDYDALATLGFESAFLDNGGSLTVIPEPSTAVFSILASAAFLRRRRI